MHAGDFTLLHSLRGLQNGTYQNAPKGRQYSSIFLLPNAVPTVALDYSDCQKNVPLCEHFYLQPLIPSFRIAKFNFKKRY